MVMLFFNLLMTPRARELGKPGVSIRSKEQFGESERKLYIDFGKDSTPKIAPLFLKDGH